MGTPDACIDMPDGLIIIIIAPLGILGMLSG
jgi:hypothetical protein